MWVRLFAVVRRSGRRDDGALAGIRVVVARLEGASQRERDLVAELRRLAATALDDGYTARSVERAARLPIEALTGDGPLPPLRPPDGPWLRS